MASVIARRAHAREPGAHRDPRQEPGDDRQRQRLDDAPDHEVGAEERQFPYQRAGIADQRPADDEGDHRAGIGAHDEKGAGHRIDGDRTARQQKAEERRDQQAGEAGFVADPARHQFARQQQRDEGADQAAGQDLGQHLAEQREVAAEDGEEMLAAVAPIDRGRGGKRDSGDRRRRPVEGAPTAWWWALTCKTRMMSAAGSASCVRAAAVQTAGRTHRCNALMRGGGRRGTGGGDQFALARRAATATTAITASTIEA